MRLFRETVHCNLAVDVGGPFYHDLLIVDIIPALRETNCQIPN